MRSNDGASGARDLLAELSVGLFWDVDPALLDADIHAGYIIPRVMEHGSWGDVKRIWSFYGSERIRRQLMEAPSLSKRTIHFFASYFSLSQADFKAQRKLSSCKTWNR